MSFRSKFDETLFKSLKNKTHLNEKNSKFVQKENYISSEEDEVNEMTIFETNTEIQTNANNTKFLDSYNKTNESLEDFKSVFCQLMYLYN